MSRLRENCNSYNLVALFHFLRSKLTKCIYLGRDSLVF